MARRFLESFDCLTTISRSSVALPERMATARTGENAGPALGTLQGSGLVWPASLRPFNEEARERGPRDGVQAGRGHGTGHRAAPVIPDWQGPHRGSPGLTAEPSTGSRVWRMSRPKLYGNEESVYVRSVRLTLEEKSCPYDLVPVDPFHRDGLSDDYLARHPFGKVPAFEHEDLRLYETGAILRYVDEAFPQPELTPGTPRLRARMNQILSIVDNYAYASWVWGLFMQEVQVPAVGGSTDLEKRDAAREPAARCLRALADLYDGEGPYLLGPSPTLADLHAFPMFALLEFSPTGRSLIAREERLVRWGAEMRSRPSVLATRSPLEP